MINDYRYTAINTLETYAEEFPEMSLTEMFYTIFTQKNLGKNIKMPTEMREVLLSGKISDKEMYESIENALNDERD